MMTAIRVTRLTLLVGLFMGAPATVAAQDEAETAAPASDVSGTWLLTMETPQGTRDITAVLEMDDYGAVTGTVTSQQGEAEIQDGQMVGDELTFGYTREMQGQSMGITYTAKVTGDEMAGTLDVGGGRFSADFTGKRENGGDR